MTRKQKITISPAQKLEYAKLMGWEKAAELLE